MYLDVVLFKLLSDNVSMIKFEETKDGYIFSKDAQILGVGVYEQGTFHLLHGDKVLPFSNAIMAFSYLRNAYEPFEPSPTTMALINTPSRAIDNLSKYRYNEHLIDMPKDVFHANLPN